MLFNIDAVSKAYAEKNVLDNISFELMPGEITGLIGQNGAGKTTLLRILLGLQKPDFGNVTITGVPGGSAPSEMFGYLPEERGLYKRGRVLETLIYFGKIKGLTHRDAVNRSLTWLDKMNLSAYAKYPCEELSKGLQQKVQWITALVHDPKILILDEPFSGLDPIHQKEFSALLMELKNGRIILLSAHQIMPIEKLCDRILILEKGQLAVNEYTSALLSKFAPLNLEQIFFKFATAL